VYARYDEVQGHRAVVTTAAERRRDEALSRNFAEMLLHSLAHNSPPIKVHSQGSPIRNVIRRSATAVYVPTVLRNTLVPTKVLVEAVNLTNATDSRRVADPNWRQWFAEAFVNAVQDYFKTAEDMVASGAGATQSEDA